MSKREPVPQSEVLGWLAANYPQLHEAAELDRSWVWLAVDLRGPCKVKGCECEKCAAAKATRQAIGQFGFRFAFKGHPLPSGAKGTWAHPCTRPMPFRHKGKGNHRNQTDNNQAGEREVDEIDAAALAFINS